MASTRITYTQVAPTDNKKWTFSCWFKRATLSVAQDMMSCYVDGDNLVKLQLPADDSLKFYQWDSGYSGRLKTNRKFRDVGAWYHVVVVFDSDNGTPGDRLRMYINGVEETSFEDDGNPDSGLVSIMNASGRVFELGAANSAQYFSGEMSHVQFVDGSALAPTEFGEVDATSGIWKLKTTAYATPGNNGVFLKMEDRTNLDLDSSSNAFTCTTGGTLTATYDNPSNNFVTLNPSDNYYPVSTFSNGNNTVVTGSSKYMPNLSTLGMSSGKFYWEVKAAARGATSTYLVGISSTQSTNVALELGNYPNDWAYYSTAGNYRNNNANSSYGDTFDTGDIIGVALDLDNNKLYFSKNGTFQNSGVPTSGATGTGAISITAAASTPLGAYFAGQTYWDASTGTFNYNFGNGYFGTTAVTSANADDAGIGAFEYDVPAGYYALCTKNIKAYG